MATIEPSQWQGNRLSDIVAVAYVPATESRQNESGMPAVIGAASPDGQPVVFGLDHLSAFLARHFDATLVCHDAARLHWALYDELERQGDAAALRTLWQFSRLSAS